MVVSKATRLAKPAVHKAWSPHGGHCTACACGSHCMITGCWQAPLPPAQPPCGLAHMSMPPAGWLNVWRWTRWPHGRCREGARRQDSPPLHGASVAPRAPGQAGKRICMEPLMSQRMEPPGAPARIAGQRLRALRSCAPVSWIASRHQSTVASPGACCGLGAAWRAACADPGCMQ